ncbi:GtrA family protein [Pseudanabaena sp. PCC 6802]|uniref:GtrA family protein n=1 Tax=Pseudanabaena sp. PCC 6802 TaxID=118173 RepID=UPI0003478014
MKRKFTNIFSRYPTYFIVGCCVTLVTIILRDIIGRFFKESVWEFVLSIIIVYLIGIPLSYVCQSRFTFTNHQKQSRSFKYKFTSYTIVYLVGMGSAILLSLLFDRLLFPLPILPRVRQTIAFIIASLITSVVTYTVSKMHIFK